MIGDERVMIMAVDPGVTAGIAYLAVAGGAGVILGAQELSCSGALAEVATRQTELLRTSPLRSGNNRYLAIEGQYPSAKVPPVVAFGLVEKRRSWEMLCLLAGMRTLDPVYPTEWQSTMYGSIMDSTIKGDRKQRKALSKSVGQMMLGRKVSEHEGDAICLGMHVARKLFGATAFIPKIED